MQKIRTTTPSTLHILEGNLRFSLRVKYVKLSVIANIVLITRLGSKQLALLLKCMISVIPWNVRFYLAAPRN